VSFSDKIEIEDKHEVGHLIRYYEKGDAIMERCLELERCNTATEVDSFLSRNYKDVNEKIGYLTKYMRIRNCAYMGGVEYEQELQYSLLRDAFLRGDWRRLGGHGRIVAGENN